jgi:ligand-binding SRPBCC domain-containing protein
LWRLRGWIDVGLGGIGMPRTRRDPHDCVVGDVIDGWHVEAYEPDRLLRLSAGLKVPGRGWLQFQVDPLDGGARSLIRQTATFDPKGIAGRLYWYGVLPLHALVFRGLLRRIAQRAVRDTAPRDLARFTHSSVLGVPAADIFRWHEQSGALAALTPAVLVRIEEQEGGIRDGGRVTVSIGLGPARLRWSIRHYGYIDGRRFCDEQVAGPFAVWRHTHLFESLGPSQALYEDRIEFAVARRHALNHLAAAMFRPLLRIAFAHRHRVVRAAVGSARRRLAPRWAAAVALLAATTLQLAAAPVQSPPVPAVPFVDLDRYA